MIFVVFLGVLLSSFSVSQSSEPVCGHEVNESMVLDEGLGQCLGQGLEIVSDDVLLDCRGNDVVGYTNSSSGIVADSVENVTVRNCNINGFYSGIVFDGVNNSQLVNVSSNSNFASGISLEKSHGNRVEGSEANGNWDGIFLENSTNNTIVDNSAHRNKIDAVHLFYGSFNNTVRNNDLTENKGHGVAPAVCGNVIEDNLAGAGGSVKYVQNAEDVSVEDTSFYSEIIFCNVNNSVIANVTIENSELNNDGILLVNSNNNTVRDSYFRDVRTGVYLFRSSDNNKVIGNSIYSSDLGIRIRKDSKNNLVAGNQVVNTTSYLKAVKNSNENRFSKNNLSGYKFSFINNESFNMTAPAEFMGDKGLSVLEEESFDYRGLLVVVLGSISLLVGRKVI